MAKFLIKLFPPIILIVISFTLYFSTFSHSIYLEDSAEFVTASHTLSVAHPSGYPTYLITTKLFSLIPFFPTIVERINFVSSIWTIVALILLHYVALKLFKSRLIAFSLVILFATSPMVWMQATYAEVYSLNTFFLILLIWSAIYYFEKKNNNRLYLFFFLYGLSLTNHFLPLVLAPLIGIWFLKNHPIKNNIIIYRNSFMFWLIGLLPYLYIPIRSAMDPAFAWFNGNTSKILKYNIAYGYNISGHTASYMADVWHQMMISFGWIGILAFAIGIGTLMYFKSKMRHLVFASLVLLSAGLIIAITNGRPYDLFASQFYQNLYVPFLLFSLIPIGYLLKKLEQSKYKIIIFYTSLLAILIWPATQIGDRFINNDRSEYVLLENYTNKLLNATSPDAILYVHHDHIMNDPLVFGLAYQRFVNNKRKDLAIYSLTPVFPPPNDFPIGTDRKQKYDPVLKKYLDENHDPSSVRTTFPRPDDWQISVSPTNYAADNLYHIASNDNLYHQSLLAKYYYDLAMQSYEKGKLVSGQRFLVRAIEHDPNQFSDYYNETLAIRNLYFGD